MQTSSGRTQRPAYEEVDWERLDKYKFFVVGAGLFSCVTTALFPLTVIKTRQMSSEGVTGGFKGAQQTAKLIWQQDGLRGYYRGFGTVVFGTLPARMVYLSALEVMKSTAHRLGSNLSISEPTLSGLSNFVGGACASAATQSIIVPIDVVSQRLMVQGMASSSPAAAAAAAARMNGLQMGRQILQQEGVKGLYRGFGASLATFVPSSAMWWGSYGLYQKLLWAVLPVSSIDPASIASSSSAAAAAKEEIHLHKTGEVVSVQVASSVLAGMTNAVLTNPLDVVKTRLQVAAKEPGQEVPKFAAVARELLAKEGYGGLWRGVFPRMVSSSLWGTAMVATYEFLKRICQVPVELVVAEAAAV